MDKAEYERIAERYIDAVYRAVLSCSKNKIDAEDAVQNAFYKLLKTDTKFNGDEHIRKWLIRVAMNECRSVWRSARIRGVISLDELEGEAEYFDESERDLFNEVMRLPQKYRAVIHLYYYEGYTCGEIAGILKIKESAVQTRLMRARSRLKERMKEE